MSGLAGRTALITGGASGIGLATAERFAAHGARVVIADLPTSQGEARASELRTRGLECLFLAMDVTNEDEVQHAVKDVMARFGGLHAIVSSAGIRGAESPISEMPFQDWRSVMTVNLDGLFFTLKHGVPALIESGGGTVVVVSSVGGMGGEPGWSAYSASKAGAIGLARSVALETIKQNVRVNAICPGYVDTPMKEHFTRNSSVREAFLKSLQPIGRFATPEEVAEVIHFLSTEQSSFLVGTVLPIDGGLTARVLNRG